MDQPRPSACGVSTCLQPVSRPAEDGQPSALSPCRTIVVVETLVSLGGLAGSIQLLAGAATPPVSALGPLGLSIWRLPAAWLFLSVAVPSGLAAWLAWRRSVWTAPAVLLASTLLATELLVQIPFLGLSMLQLIFGGVAAGMAIVGLLARRAGLWPNARRTVPVRSVIPLERARPLWRLDIIPGFPEGRIGVLLVFHHVVADGLRGVALVTSLLDSTPLTQVDEVHRVG
jgi:Wax ester synthase-like Acyl-CoA acyltransferase domain